MIYSLVEVLVTGSIVEETGYCDVFEPRLLLSTAGCGNILLELSMVEYEEVGKAVEPLEMGA